ncbi:restriction endonuclease [Sulfitobacter geojensis]|nr:restriction endonuclease [Sulfitobacter geojensis]
MASRRNWTDGEVTEALALYLRIPFGQFDKANAQVKLLAARIGRTPSAVALKLSNLAALDESIPQKGMANASAADRRVWASFMAEPTSVIHAFANQIHEATETSSRIGFSEQRRIAWEEQQGVPKMRLTEQRLGQAFFREIVLTSYHRKCALTGIDDSRLLTASHIIGWKEDRKSRLNPSNGICLNALHDRAFDRHMITFDEDYRLVIAPDVPFNTRELLQQNDVDRLNMPERFLPDQAFLQHHRKRMEERLS